MLGKQLPIPAVASPNVSKQNNRFTCICCRIKFDSADLQRNHFKTEWHLYNLKRRVCDLEPIDLDAFIAIQMAAPLQDDETSTLYAESTCSTSWPKGCLEGRRVNSQEDEDDDEDDWEFLDEEYQEDELDDLLSQIISSDTCLFCDKKSPTTEVNVKHMDQAHGFFIPEYRYLIDLDGLLEYLGFKVGAGTTCLWCNKQFTSLHGVRLHMIYKDHCKIFYDQERALSEFKEYYDYTTQETFELKPPNQISLSSSRAAKRRGRPSKVLARYGSVGSSTGPLIECKMQKAARSLEKRSIKKFQVDRAKIALRTLVAGNNTLRDRFREQNPK